MELLQETDFQVLYNVRVKARMTIFQSNYSMALSTKHLDTTTPLPAVFMGRVKFGCDCFHPACQLTEPNL